jgi:hypothetical protein
MAARPYDSVQVNFDNSSYDNVCLDYGGGPASLSAWRELGDLLARRAGWHFDVVSTGSQGEPLWSAGLFGESRLNIHVDQDGRFACFDYDADKAGDADPDTTCATIAEVEAWIAARADRAGRPSAAAVAYARDSDWALLKTYAHPVTVTWSDGAYHASLSGLFEASAAATLQDALGGVASLLCGLLGAPAGLASQVPLTACLDQAAVQRLREHGA